ncbi:MAG: DUF1266 domain-containing protein [Blautia sp.]|nr:DUF1266 domain-containing protein [Lachnoclostridium sp.]MCM1211674.1 DUF1266 domain-containing protein [Blautia sp.]
MKKTNKKRSALFALLTILCLCALTGCGMAKSVTDAVLKAGAEDADRQDIDAVEPGSGGDIAGAATKESEDAAEADGEDGSGQEAGGEKTTTMSDLIGSSDESTLPDTILWFNATYAPLTYSNSGDWKLVAGLEPSGINKELEQYLMERDWDIQDRDSALETIEWLKEEGHRESFRECGRELAAMGILDYEEEAFLEALTESGIEEDLFRYVMVYYLYQEGLDEDAIAAWDLCRVNQLYADFYICGYMTYEEAMDASLENSRVLQQMYSSWDELMDSYMLGYQFWQSDPCLTEDSPTMQRYGYYEILCEMDNGPYTLDWNMELEKSW